MMKCNTAALIRALSEFVDGEENCIEWRGSLDPNGYGRVHIGEYYANYGQLAHRVVYQLLFGKTTACLCHRCDNPPCVNPRHIFVGTRADNVYDAIAKKRHCNPPRRIGEAHNKARLSNREVLHIRELYRSGMRLIDISRKLQLPISLIHSIVYRITWNHL